MMSPKRKTFWFDEMVNECHRLFGWKEEVAAYAIATNKDLVQGLLTQQSALKEAANKIESVFTILLKEGNYK